jgi:hypothetical protein
MPRAGIEPAIPTAKRPQTYALDRTAIGVSGVHQTPGFVDCSLTKLSVNGATKLHIYYLFKLKYTLPFFTLVSY